ncbi:MAG: VWA domain-containing protein [Deltaproteobacteria bacterium]|nr:VWA domain-containing protein [Deltaproteobacteria bacterium]
MLIRNSRCRRSGIYLTLVALFVFVLLGFVALVVGLGFISTDKTRLQNALNLAALGALEAYTRESGDHNSRCTVAVERANEIIGLNKLPGVKEQLGFLGGLCRREGAGPGPGGSLSVGMWLRERPENSDPCKGEYPCFHALDSGPTNIFPVINAVKIDGKTQSDNKLIVPIARVLGRNAFQITATATASIVPRCLALLLDVSMSTTQETHYQSFNTDDNGLINQDGGPESGKYGFFAIRYDDEVKVYENNPYLCSQIPLDTDECSNRLDKVAFCDLLTRQNRGNDTNRYNHYRSDYGAFTGTPFGDLLVDNRIDERNEPFFYGAEPLGTYYFSFNLALRMLLREASGEDRAALIVFRSQMDVAPDGPPKGLSRDFSSLVNLTNLKNRTDGEDNFIKRGWLPVAGVGNTNIVGALDLAITQLSNPVLCPEEAHRVIILASDGVMNCARKEGVEGNEYRCSGDYNTYKKAEEQLLGSPPGAEGSILQRLQRSNITLTSLIRGAHVEPNFKNVRENGNGRLIDLAEAWVRNPDISELVDGEPGFRPSTPPDECITQSDGGIYNEDLANKGAFEHLTRWTDKIAGDECDGIQYRGIFRRVNRVFAQMSLASGGIWCPLMDQCVDSSPACDNGTCYEPDPEDPECGCKSDCDPSDINCCESRQGCVRRLKPRLRRHNVTQTCAIKDMSPAMQAAECAVQSLGTTPFALVEEEE